MSWSFTEHACRECLGPILQCDNVFTCAVCRVEAKASPTPICGCGIRPRQEIGRPQGHFRCMVNTAQTAANPARIVIGFAVTPPVLDATDEQRSAA